MAKSKATGNPATTQKNWANDAIFVDWELNKDEQGQFRAWVEEFGDSFLSNIEDALGADFERITIAWQDKGDCWAVWIFQRRMLHATNKYVLAVRGKTISSALLHAGFKHLLCQGNYESRAKQQDNAFIP